MLTDPTSTPSRARRPAATTRSPAGSAGGGSTPGSGRRGRRRTATRSLRPASTAPLSSSSVRGAPSTASSAAPTADALPGRRGTRTASSFSSSTSRTARSRPPLRAPPPTTARGVLMLRPRSTVARKLRISARQSPYAISSTGVPFCCRWIMSDLANTAQRPATVAPRGASAAMVASSPMDSCRRPACCSRKAPAPAAQRSERAKSASSRCSGSSSIQRDICPPISTAASASGHRTAAPRAVATTSLTWTAAGMCWASRLRAPATRPTRKLVPCPAASASSSRSVRAASGRPPVARDALQRISSCSPITATWTATEPMSMPSRGVSIS